MKKLLTLKHWQVFLILTTGFLLNFILVESDFKIGPVSSLLLAVIVGIISLILFFGWVLTIGIFVNGIQDNPYHLRQEILIFAVLSCLIGYSELNLERLAIENLQIPDWVGIILTPLTFFGIIYTFYNVPKSLNSIELDRKVPFRECVVDAFLLFAFPIGVWFIQPRINRLFLANELLENENE